IYYYAQLGNWNSDKPDDTSLWNIPRYTEEVEQVRKGLGLDRFYLFGHSWGGMLALEYALKYQQHLKGLIISDMAASVESAEKYGVKIKSKMPADVVAKMDEYEKAGKYEDPAYQDLVMKNLYAQYVCR